MTQRLYYFDAYQREFTATIQERVQENERWAIVLDKTYLYPTSGGQPHDTGQINDTAVSNVTIRETDGAILHWLATAVPLTGDSVTAVIDWERRFDHMQQHTGQHILSQAFIRVANAATVGFHLSDATVTIDLDASSLTSEQITHAEHLANQIVWENRPVKVRMVEHQEARDLPLRKIPAGRNGRLRLIDITDFDLTACGGTHVDLTGAVGLIKVVKQERRGDQIRIEFCCGRRALTDYGQKHAIITDLTTELTTAATELLPSVQKLQSENKEAGRTIKKLQSTLMENEAERLLAAAETIGDVRLVTHTAQALTSQQLRFLGSQLADQKQVIALLGLASPKMQLFFVRSTDAPGDMDRLLQTSLQTLGQGGGGGSTNAAQGGGPAVGNGRLHRALNAAAKQLREQLRTSG